MAASAAIFFYRRKTIDCKKAGIESHDHDDLKPLPLVPLVRAPGAICGALHCTGKCRNFSDLVFQGEIKMAPKLRELGICAVAAMAAATALPSQASPWSVRNDNRLGYLKTVIEDHYVTVYKVPFRGGETARVEVSGDGSSDLDLTVLDENGNEVCKDEDDTDDMSCSWRPRFTGDFFIRISNRGDANAYVLMYN